LDEKFCGFVVIIVCLVTILCGWLLFEDYCLLFNDCWFGIRLCWFVVVDCWFLLVWESDDEEVVAEFTVKFLVWFVRLIDPDDADEVVLLYEVDEVVYCKLEVVVLAFVTNGTCVKSWFEIEIVWDDLLLAMDWESTMLDVAFVDLRVLRTYCILVLVVSKLINWLLTLYLSKIKLLLAGYTYTPTRLLVG